MDLKQETIDFLQESNYNINDVDYVTDGEHWCSFEDFMNQLGHYYQYDNDYGRAEINTNLQIVMKDSSIIQRYEYDGKEWWEIYCPFKKTNYGKLKIKNDQIF